jgi:hypothetical protein
VAAPSTFGLGRSATWGPDAKLTVAATHGCFAHEDCANGLFCSVNKIFDPTRCAALLAASIGALIQM